MVRLAKVLAVVIAMEDVRSVPQPYHLCVVTRAVPVGMTIAAVKANSGAWKNLEAFENVVGTLN